MGNNVTETCSRLMDCKRNESDKQIRWLHFWSRFQECVKKRNKSSRIGGGSRSSSKRKMVQDGEIGGRGKKMELSPKLKKVKAVT